MKKVERMLQSNKGGMAAAVCRDSHGLFLGSASLVFPGVNDPAMFQVLACREAFALPQDLHLQNFVISLDSKQVVADIVKGSRGKYGAIINEIKSSK